MGKLNWMKSAYALFLLCAATAIALPGQTFTTLHSFEGSDGDMPLAGLIQATDGNLYGTTENGGANGEGTVFKITRSGTLTTLYSFCSPQIHCTDGLFPVAGLVQATDGNLYGTTQGPVGTSPYGTVFKITLTGTLTTLHYFCSQTDCTDGVYPAAPLIQATDGNLYGTTAGGGANATGCEGFGCGTVFKITPGGTLTTLYSFCSQSACTDGGVPYAGLVQATNGNFYGTTGSGGAHAGGTVFKITSSGTLTTLYTFCSQTDCTDGASPQAGLVQATDGNLYGTTAGGGANATACGIYDCGTVFKITPGGALTTLYSFCSQSACSDGDNPVAALIQATDGIFYGTTSEGGANSCFLVQTDVGCGTVFKITPGGTLTTLYSFCSQGGSSCTDGANPYAGLVQDTNGNLYGTTDHGGANGAGTVFSLPLPLPLVVSLSPTSLTFPAQQVGTSSSAQSVTLSNTTGSGVLSLTSITVSGDFSQTNTCGSSVAAGDSCTLNVTFTPTVAGSRSGTLTIADNASASPQTVSLTGTGIAPVASVSPPSLMFGNQNLGTASGPQPVSLSNTGNTAFTITRIGTSANFGQTNNCGGSVAASFSCTINVTFAPMAAGSFTGTLTITDNSNGVAGSTQTVSLSGTGTAVSFSPTSLNFGAKPVGSRSLKTVTLTNLGSTPLSISGLTVVSFAPLTPLGTKAGDFAIQSGSCVAGGSVAGLGSCTINLLFKPTAAGVRSATLVIADSDPSSPQTVNLRGTGTAVRPPETSPSLGP